MTHQTDFSDEELTAYLDGQASDVLCAAIDTALENDPAVAEQLAGLDMNMQAVSLAFEDLLGQAPTMPDFDALEGAAAGSAPPVQEPISDPAPLPTPANTNSTPSIGLWGALGVFGTGIAAGIAMMTFVVTDAVQPAPAAPGWKAVVASYQSLYSPETLTGPAPNASEAQAQLQLVSGVIGADLTQLPDVDGLTFKRAQILGFNGKPLVQLAFARADGTPVALCIIPAKSKDATPMSQETLQGMASASWNTDGLAYLLIGGDRVEATQGEATRFAQWAETVSDI